MTDEMTKADRDALIRVARARAKQAEHEADARAKTLLAEVMNDVTAEYKAREALWVDAVTIAEEYVVKANDQIRTRCAELGIPPDYAPGLVLNWRPRSPQLADRDRRGELLKLAETRLAALVQNAKTISRATALNIEEQLILGGLQSDEARSVFASMPTVEQLMPPLSLEDLGVKRWQPPEDAAAQLLTPLTPTDRKRRQILRAIEANPTASNRRIAQIAGCDHKTVATYRRDLGETPAITGESATAETEDDAP